MLQIQDFSEKFFFYQNWVLILGILALFPKIKSKACEKVWSFAQLGSHTQCLHNKSCLYHVLIPS